MEELARAQERTQEFLTLIFTELRALGRDPEADSVLLLCRTQAPLLTTPEEHYALREIAASAYTEGAYHYIMKLWNEGPAIPASGPTDIQL